MDMVCYLGHTKDVAREGKGRPPHGPTGSVWVLRLKRILRAKMAERFEVIMSVFCICVRISDPVTFSWARNKLQRQGNNFLCFRLRPGDDRT